MHDPYHRIYVFKHDTGCLMVVNVCAIGLSVQTTPCLFKQPIQYWKENNSASYL